MLVSLAFQMEKKMYGAKLDVNDKGLESRQPCDQTQPAWVYERQVLLDQLDLLL